MASRDEKRARRERAEQMRVARERQEKRRRNLITAAVVAVVLVVVAGAGFAVKSALDDSADAPARTPDGLTDGGVVVGAADLGGTAAGDPVAVTVFEDFACPHCASFESETGPWLDEQVKAGAIEVTYRPVAFISDFSSDAMAAAACVFEEGGAKAYRDYATLVFERQSDAPDTSELASLAGDAGAPGAADCIESRPFRDWAAQNGGATKAAFDDPDANGDKLSGTPTVWVDGVTVNGPEDADGNPTVPQTSDIQEAVQAAQKG